MSPFSFIVLIIFLTYHTIYSGAAKAYQFFFHVHIFIKFKVSRNLNKTKKDYIKTSLIYNQLSKKLYKYIIEGVYVQIIVHKIIIWVEIISLFEEKRLVARHNCYIHSFMKIMHIFAHIMQWFGQSELSILSRALLMLTDADTHKGSHHHCLSCC